MRLLEYIDHLIANGKCCFSLDQACEKLQKNRSLVIKSIDYYKKQGKLASPAQGFYVIVSAEYRIYGCLPAEYFIPHLMQYWQQKYYAGLLTAASYHGAAHQQPQIFQIITNKKRPPIKCGKIKIVFYFKKEFNNISSQYFSTPKSILNISTPEQTAIDLFLYPKQSGGLNHIATVMSELSEKIDGVSLSLLLKKFPYGAWQQRMGYVCEQLKEEQLSLIIKQNIDKQKRVIKVPLVPGLEELRKNNEYNKKWKLIVNSKIEADT